MMKRVYLRMMFFSVRMKSDVGPEVAAAAAAEAGRFDPISAKLVTDPALLCRPLDPLWWLSPPPRAEKNAERDDDKAPK